MDVFVYAFEVPGTLDAPGIPAEINFDEPNVPETALAPFGQTLGVAEATPFTLPDDPTVREHTTRSLLEFDVASLGIDADRVRSASLSVTGIGNLPPFAAPSEEFPIAVDLKPVLEDRDGGAVTWNTRPEVGGLVDSTVMSDGVQTLTFDLTAQVMAWIEDPSANHGVEMSRRDVVRTDMPSMFAPNDLFAAGLFAPSANPDASIRPVLAAAEVPVPASALLPLGGGGLPAGMGRMRRRG